MDRTGYLIALLGGEAGLWCGEMMALEWSDVDLGKPQLCIQRSDWKGHVTVTKGGRLRCVPMTLRLATALREHRHLRGARVLANAATHRSRRRSSRSTSDEQPGARSSRRAASIGCDTRSVHISRCAARRHERFRSSRVTLDLATTQRYMHLSPAAIRLLDQAKQ
jgi:integrase